jgi:3-hydroxyacyl-[acyl-carrier-protein] dehydratase
MDYLALLPHAPPMRLIEHVVELVPGERAHCRRDTAESDFYFDGHFPGQPVVPAVILVELVAQAGGLAAGAPTGDRTASIKSLRVAALGPFKFPAAAGPGVTLDVFARVVGRLGGLFKIEGEVMSDGRLLASGSVTLAG